MSLNIGEMMLQSSCIPTASSMPPLVRFDTSAVKWKKSAIAEVLFILPSGLDILPPQYIETR
eukprot:scaffold9706_cov103-Cylindrotheca_fusiformis.AAC.1